MNNTRNEAPSGADRGRALKLSTLGLYAVSIMVACSSDPSVPTVHLPAGAGAPGAGAGNTAGAPAAGATSTAGAPSAGAPAGGDTGTAGAPSAGAPAGGGGGDTTAGAGGGSAGAPVIVAPAPPSTFYVDDIQWVAGSAGGAGGSGGAGAGAGGGGAAGAAGTAGAGGAAAAAMCSTATKAPLPYTVTSGFVASGYEGGDAAMSGGTQLSQGDCTAGDRAPGAIGKCTAFTYTPASPATWAGIAYLTGAGFGKPGTPVCLADGATAVSFYAKGKVGGESVSFSATNASAVSFVLTTAWTQYSIPVTPGYSTDAAGLVQGFVWTIAPSP